MKIKLGNWLYNAGIVGLLRILEEKGVEIKKVLKDECIEITPDILDNFEYAYAKYIVKYCFNPLNSIFEKAKIGKRKEKDRENLQKQQKLLQEIKYNLSTKYLNELCKLIKPTTITNFKTSVKDLLDKFLKEFYKEVHENFNDEIANSLYNQIKKNLEIKKGKKQKSIIDNISEFNFLYTFLTRFYHNKAVVGNPSFKGNRLQGFKETYIKPAQSILKNSNPNNEILCRFCNQIYINIKTKKVFGKELFSITGASPNEFSNFFLNLECDLFICPICELILLCSFAGFTEIPPSFRDEFDIPEYIFVNMPSLELLYQENEKLKKFYQLSKLNTKDSIYEEVLDDLILNEKKKKSWWVLQNILFIEIKPKKGTKVEEQIFRYFHIGKDLAELFTEDIVISLLKKLKGKLLIQKRGNQEIRVSLKKETIRRLLSDDNVYFLAYLNLRRYIDDIKENNASFHSPINSFYLSIVQNIKKIINLKYKGGDTMETETVYGILKKFLDEGKKLKLEEDPEEDFKKRIRYSYKLLSLIRAGKYVEFYQDVMKLYINSKKPIPENILGLLNPKDIVDFEAKACAFISGFLHKETGDSTQIQNQQGGNENE